MRRGPIVVDSSTLVLAVADDTTAGVRALESLPYRTAHAPHLVDAEVGNALRKLVLRRELAVDEAAVARHRAARLVRRRHAHRRLNERAWELWRTVSYYDALYVALAETLGCPLLTADARLARASGPHCEIELLTA